ncbi:putative angiopoietin-related protein 1 [Apostichopus japonicus]|uniref:Putative angiopoietin-related protein 1 n=2 Tax=Stichopus japonicus TaxID=307972 RepID=A0A2G8KNQ8_STIJA|nr:putative angiopoietin-related protein 1 [Apostichopus japonicus]
MDNRGHGWTVIQRRVDGSEDFNRNWREYTRGFGNLTSEFWLGLDSMHNLLQQYPYRLMVELVTWDGSKLLAEYAGFMLGNKKGNYRLRLDSFISGNATDALEYHAGSPFTTVDKDNDDSSVNCAVVHHGGWWFKSCDRSNLNGLYRTNPHYNGLWDDGIEWKEEDGPPFYSYRMTVMKVRPME